MASFENGVLRLSKEDLMRDYKIGDIHRPWHSIVEEVRSIEIEDGTPYIGSAAFDGCVRLGSAVLPSSVHRIGKFAFRGCSSLNQLRILASTIEIHPRAFDGCDRLRVFEATNTDVCNRALDALNCEDDVMCSVLPVEQEELQIQGGIGNSVVDDKLCTNQVQTEFIGTDKGMDLPDRNPSIQSMRGPESDISENIKSGKRAPCILLIDTSSSMNSVGDSGRKKIDELNDGLKVFCQAINSDSRIRHLIDICVLTFNSKAELIVPFHAANSFQIPALQVGGHAAVLNEAIVTGLDYAYLYREENDRRNIPHWRPWVFLVTAGRPSDIEYTQAAIDRLHDAISEKKVFFFPLGIGSEVDYSLLRRYNKNGDVFKSNNSDLKDAFSWLADCLTAIACCPGDTNDIELLPPSSITML